MSQFIPGNFSIQKPDDVEALVQLVFDRTIQSIDDTSDKPRSSIWDASELNGVCNING